MCNTPTADTDSIFLEVGLRGVFRGGGPLHTSCQVLSSFIQGRWESGSLWPESPSAQWRWQPNYLCHFQLRLKDITLWKECHLSSKLSVKYLWVFFFIIFEPHKSYRRLIRQDQHLLFQRKYLGFEWTGQGCRQTTLGLAGCPRPHVKHTFPEFLEAQMPISVCFPNALSQALLLYCVLCIICWCIHLPH